MAEIEHPPKKDLRILFRTNVAGLAAEQIFIDRDGEREAFEHAFRAHSAQIKTRQCDPVDVVAPRRNIISYYGVGGIGKTTLSQHLQAWVSGEDGEPHWPPFESGGARVLTARLDLSRDTGLDFETMLVVLRVAACQGSSLYQVGSVIKWGWSRRGGLT